MTTPSANDDDTLNSQLEALFDAPEPATLPPQAAPPTPNPNPTSKKSILDALLDNKSRLTGRAAEIANDVANLQLPVTNRASIKHAMLQRRLAPSTTQTTHQQQRAKRARNAFKIVGRDAVRRKVVPDFIDTRFTNMSLRDPVYDRERLTAIFEHAIRVDVADIKARETDIRSGRMREFVVFACLVQKHAKKESKAGSKYAVWSVYNMPRGKVTGCDVVPEATLVTVLLFDEAFDAFHTQVPGGVYAFRKPKLLPPRVGEAASRKDQVTWSGYTLSVSKKSQMIPLGVCKDYKLCETPVAELSACGAWYDANRLKACVRHTKKARATNLTGTRMDVNNAERPTIARDVMENVSAPRNISMGAGAGAGRGWGDEEVGEKVDAEGERRRRVEREKIRRLTMGRGRGGNLGGVESGIAAARRRDAERWGGAGMRRLGGQVLPLQKAGEGGLQKRYEEAVRVLRKCGFLLEGDGALVPQGEGKMAVRVLCGRRDTENK